MKADNSFNCCITAKISAVEATQKISNPRKWWSGDFTGNPEKVKDKFTVNWPSGTWVSFTVAELTPGKRVVWLVTDCNLPHYNDKKEWNHTKVIFNLTENSGVTTLDFEHEGLTPKVECYKDCEAGWTHWIKTSLLSYFTTGKGVAKK